MMRPGLYPALALLVTGLGSAVAEDRPPTDEEARFFETNVRPVLVDQCFKCHGPAKQKSNLRLDSRAAILAGGDLGPAVVPGKPEESPLVAAVKYEEDGPKMPPSGKLPPNQVEALSRWVKMGAPWPGEAGDAANPPPAKKAGFSITDKDRSHWAFRPVRRPDAPAVKESSWVASPIDAFVLAGLEKKGLRPNPPASKAELLRRVTYDLTGLPPTPAEVEAYLKDEAPDAYEKVVDRLLASPRYGEAWGRRWLDLVRFAETNSYERDGVKPSAWRFRDYVIRSLNADKPYDRFVREQLAGDELPGRDVESVTATGFYRLGIWDDEPVDREQARFDGYDDVVATTGQVFLGLTIDCARCHDHKLDPIAQKDYYRFVSFFRNVNHYRNGGPTDEMPIVEPGHEEEAARIAREQDERRAKAEATVAGIEEEYRRRSEAIAAVRGIDVEDLRYRFYRDTWDRLPDFDAIKPEDSGELPSGLFDLSPRTRDEAFGFVFEGFLNVPNEGVYTFSLDSDDGSRLKVDGKAVAEHDGIHGEGSPRVGSVALKKGRVPIRLEYFQNGHGLGLTVAWSGPGVERRPLSAGMKKAEVVDVRAAIRKDGAKVLGPERVDRYQQARRVLAELRTKTAATGTVLCVTEAGPVAPETFVLARGNPHAPGEKVEPAFLEVLGGTPANVPSPPPGAKTTGRRLALADWIASPSNPLTARVMANRVFQGHFGRGIVRSPSNFGLQGDPPTHPELLDWLASELVAGGWRLKPLHKTIVMSNAYQMSSRANPDALAKDPTNDSLWRMDMRRLSAEEVRDSILSASGTLNLAMFGPGVYPEIPREVLAGQSVPGSGWGKSSPEEQARRSIYVHVKRSLLLPILESFDLAETDRSTPSRFSTTQPTQALGMLNGDFLNRQADLLAVRLRREAGDRVEDRVRLALRLVSAREPSEADVRRGANLIAGLEAKDGLGPDAALKAFCLVALNLNEFLYLD